MKVEMIFVVQLLWNSQVSGDVGHLFGVYWVLKWEVQATHEYCVFFFEENQSGSKKDGPFLVM